MLVTYCLEFSGKTRAVPEISPVKRSWLCSDISASHQADVSSVPHLSPVKQRLYETDCSYCLPSDGACGWLLYL